MEGHTSKTIWAAKIVPDGVVVVVIVFNGRLHEVGWARKEREMDLDGFGKLREENEYDQNILNVINKE